MIFPLIYLLFQSNFLLAVNGNEESIRMFFTNAMRCLQHIARETDRGGYDSMILDRLFFELNGYARTILFLSQQFEGGVDQESFVTLEALHLCFCAIINSFQNSRPLQMSQREMLTSRGPPTIITGWGVTARWQLRQNPPDQSEIKPPQSWNNRRVGLHL